ncbi:hypothetical protein E2C01_056439 [Portunus trituberculatus]|uniref:Uncharacterized protein n=1 Tax=Portunus trituberculatus TaxID=210409 RepID=A0A5B7GY67_PORTR|nr:hypothetical protein [Portunus trituberculatus]
MFYPFFSLAVFPCRRSPATPSSLHANNPQSPDPLESLSKLAPRDDQLMNALPQLIAVNHEGKYYRRAASPGQLIG